MLFIGAAIGAAVNIGTSIFGAIQANKAKKAQIKMAEDQMAKSNKLRENAEANRVDYKAPVELQENIDSAKADLAAGDAVVQGAVDTAQQTVANTGAAAQRTATSGAQALAAVQSANVESGKEINAAKESAEERKARKKAELARARQNIAGSKDKEYDVNVAQPYFQAISDARQLEAASIQNQQGAINTGAQNAGNMAKGIGKAGDLLSQIDFKGMFSKKG